MGFKWSKTVNLATAIIDFAVAVVMMMIAVSGRSILAFGCGILFVAMGVFFLRYYERQRRLEKMTDEERAEFFKSGEAILVPGEIEKLTAEKQKNEGINHTPKH
ncbi:MAG: hypothetical protein Q4C56_05730 [Peptococcaceae bacterium]|nr:hypothetical protein [Peptococcaceae bacterium]